MNKIYRVIDANVNRASEGLRVLEDIFRLFYNNDKFVKAVKEIRHSIRKACSDLKFLKSRDISTDSGKSSFTNTEKSRKSVEDIYLANSKRVEESLRVLEEFFKIVNESKSFLFKELRFKIYRIEEELFSVKHKFQNILKCSKTTLYTIVDSRFCIKERLDTCVEILKGGAKILQLREKVLSDREKIKIGKAISKLCRDFGAIFIVNDRVDIALYCEADGVHLGQDDIPVELAKDILGINKIYGLSTHTFKQVKEAATLSIDYIGFGPIFPTKSKENPDPVVGTESLKKVKKEYKNLPVCAIGGINFSNIESVLEATPEMVCVMSGITMRENIKKEVENYRRVINDTVNLCK